MRDVLHVTNGDSAVAALVSAGFERALLETGGDFMAAQAMVERPFLADTTAVRIHERAQGPARTYLLGGVEATRFEDYQSGTGIARSILTVAAPAAVPSAA